MLYPAELRGQCNSLHEPCVPLPREVVVKTRLTLVKFNSNPVVGKLALASLRLGSSMSLGILSATLISLDDVNLI